MKYALAFFIDNRCIPVGDFETVDQAARAASIVNIEREGRGLAPVVAVVDRATLTVQKWL